jgi:hypothetical protein
VENLWQKIAEQGISLSLAVAAIVVLWRALQAERKDHVASLRRVLGEESDDIKPR